jgi:hypothetical protein
MFGAGLDESLARWGLFSALPIISHEVLHGRLSW